MQTLVSIYRKLFARPLFYALNLKLFNLVLRGVGVLNFGGYEVTGENWLQRYLLEQGKIKTIVDVGASFDPYGLDFPATTKVYALEPHHKTFKKLLKNSQNYKNIKCFQIGLSDKKGSAKLYDMSPEASSIASLNKENITRLPGTKLTEYVVKLSTLDEFVKEQKTGFIDLLKIDTEGTEFKVLLGAKNTLAKKQIGMIVFEFNEMNVYSRVFMKDFYDLLTDFTFYRLMPNGLLPLGEYSPIKYELFGFQNIVAIQKGWKITL